MQPQKELQLDLKSNNTQNCQKIELYGSPATRDLKKPHSSRRVGGAEKQRGVHWFLKRNFAGKKGLARSIQSDEKNLQPRLLYAAIF